MKITCRKDRLNFAVQTVQKAVATKATLPLLTGIYISADNGSIELQATDYEIGIRCSISAQVEQPGRVVLSGRYFQDLVRRLPGESVEIAVQEEDKTIRISSGTAQFHLLSMPPEEFPTIQPLATGSNSLTVKNSTLRELIRKTVFACAADESRPIFTGGLLEVFDNEIRMVATNTHRLALKKIPVENGSNGVKMIIPAKILHELARITSTDEEPSDVQITWQKNQVAFIFDGVYITSRLIEGSFPDYAKVIPDSFQTKVILDTGTFLDAVERVSLLSRQADYNVIKFSFTGDHVIITSNNPDIGKAQENIPAEREGNDLDISFNARYVIDILKNIDGEKISFCLNSPIMQASIQPLDDENYTYIITPVRTN